MWRCCLCDWECELDDVIVGSIVSGRCVCVSCYYREVKAAKKMSGVLRRDIRTIVNATA